MKGVFGVAKYAKVSLYFEQNDVRANEKIENLCNEFPEIKVIGNRDDDTRSIYYIDIKYPLKIKDNVTLYLQKRHIPYF